MSKININKHQITTRTEDLMYECGYKKGISEGYKKALKDCKAKRAMIPYTDEFDFWLRDKLRKQK